MRPSDAGLLERKEITQQRFAAVIRHGDAVLARAGLTKPVPHEGPFVDWMEWRLVLFGKMYKPKYKSLEEWALPYGVKSA